MTQVSKRVTIRIKIPDYKRIWKKAADLGLTVSEYMRRKALAE